MGISSWRKMIFYDQCSSLVLNDSLWSRWSMMSTMLALLLAGHFSCLALASEGGKTSGRFLQVSVVFQHPRWHEQWSNPWVVVLYTVLDTILMLQMFARVLQDSRLFRISEIHAATMSLTCELMSPTHAGILSIVQLSIWEIHRTYFSNVPLSMTIVLAELLDIFVGLDLRWYSFMRSSWKRDAQTNT